MHYKIYLLDSPHHMYREGDFHSETDAAATQRLREIHSLPFGAELWERGRLVACVRQSCCGTCQYEPAARA